MIRKWDITNENDRQRCLNEIIARVDEQAGSTFGVIAAQDIIDIVAYHLGPQVYNVALDDAIKAIDSKLADIEVDLNLLRAMPE